MPAAACGSTSIAELSPVAGSRGKGYSADRDSILGDLAAYNRPVLPAAFIVYCRTREAN